MLVMLKMKRGGMLKSRKAQITVFIIIGVILLFSTGVFIYLKQTGVGPGKYLQPKTPPVESSPGIGVIR